MALPKPIIAMVCCDTRHNAIWLNSKDTKLCLNFVNSLLKYLSNEHNTYNHISAS